MLLISYGFGLFLAALVLLYYLVPGRFQWVLLLAASYLFYLIGGGIYILYPMATTVSTWLLARRIGRITRQSKEYMRKQEWTRQQKKEYQLQVKKTQRRWMIFGLAFNFGILAVLKYTNFVLGNVNGLLRVFGADGEFALAGWLLPLGISYYTFQSMGYLIDVYYRKYEPEKSLARFALFVSFFPQLTAGPIGRYDQMNEELYAEHSFCSENLRLGFERMLWGYLKKLVVADRLGPAVVTVISAPEVYDGIYVLLGMIGYTVWMYADFSGGIDIVLGAAEMFGIHLAENFERPFFSRNLGEFWRRWHISLMTWLREYIFYPVSMSRAAKKLSELTGGFFGKEAARKIPVYFGSVVVWLTAGIWHGASWNFVAWGMANCIVMLASQECAGLYRAYHKRFSFSNAKGYRYFEMIRTFFLFACLEMFEYYSFGNVFLMFGNMVSTARFSQLFDGRWSALGLGRADLLAAGVGILLMFLVSVWQEKGRHVRRTIEEMPWLLHYGFIFGMCMMVLIVGVYGHGYDASQFIYNQF
ncbi:MAG: MBOAT family protein [Clostridiales bacterium]|nr:MBOAT family protein [Clostridiales bacterium]